jgi:exonuclease SbcD
MSFRIIATSDNHLGRYQSHMSTHILEERRKRLRQALGRVIDYAIEEQVHLLVLAGDVFDTPNPRNADRVYLARRLRDLERAGVSVVAIGGNHDTPRSATEQGGYPPLTIYAELEALTFFDQLPLDDRVVHPVIFQAGDLRVAVGGFTPNVNLSPDRDPLNGVIFADPGADVRVLVVHAPIEGTVYPEANIAIISRSSLEQLKDVDLVIAGDIHRFASFKVGRRPIVIPGATEWMDYDDCDMQPGFAIVDIRSRTDITIAHKAITPQPRAKIVIHAHELGADDPTGIILSRLKPESDPDKLVRLVIDGKISRATYQKLNLTTIEDEARRLFFFFELDLSHLTVQFSQDGRGVSAPRRSIHDEINAVVDHFLTQASNQAEGEILQATRRELLSALEELVEA